MPGMRLIVVGGGIGGLGAAIALSRAGHEVVVLERVPRLESVGAGITLFANAMRALDHLGVGDAVRGRGAAARHSAILTSGGRQLLSLDDDLLEGAVAIRRSDLQTILRDAAAGVRLGAVVTSVESTADAAVARLEDGTQERGDLLVGADGVRSLVRAAISPATPRYGGYTAWRGLSPVSIESGRLTESWGIGERFGLVDVGRQTYWFATANTPEAEPEGAAERKSALMARFAGWHDPVGAVLEATPDEAILRNDVYYLDPLPRWSSGRIVLLGDAAHATTPGIGQGAAQALEDAVALTAALNAPEIDAALARYESARRTRAELTQRLSRQADRAAQLASPLGCRLRNAIASHAPAKIRRRQIARGPACTKGKRLAEQRPRVALRRRMRRCRCPDPIPC